MDIMTVSFNTTIHQFEEHGDKTGWTYIIIPADIAEQLNPGSKKSFRVKGKLDEYKIAGISLLPMGGGSYIMALNAAIRKNIHKGKGAMLQVQLDADNKPVTVPQWILECLKDEPKAIEHFNTLAKSHQQYFVKWIESAKTEETKTKRMAMTVTALARKQGYGEMLRAAQKDRME
jgi:hypothetical protein